MLGSLEIECQISLSILSDRQLEIAKLVANGYGNQEIANRLGLSKQTINNHLYRIYTQLGLDNRIQLAVAYTMETLEHRNYVAYGAPFSTGAAVFSMMYELGLQPHHTLVDVGCGSLRVGRFLIMYLEKGCYFGIEQNKGILNAGIEQEVTRALCNFKDASFSNNNHYRWYDAGIFFDWVLISGVLVHKSHAEIEKALFHAHDMLKIGGSCIVDYYPSWPHWNEDYDPSYPQIAPHERECLLIHPGFTWTGFDKELFGAHYIQLVKNGIANDSVINVQSS